MAASNSTDDVSVLPAELGAPLASLPSPQIAPPEVLLLSVAAIIVVGVVGEAFFRKTGIPDVAFLMVLGVVVGPVLGIVGAETAIEIVPYFAALALILIMFDGGLNLSIYRLVSVSHYAIILSVAGFAGSVAVVSVIALFGLGWDLMPSLLLGIMVGGSSSIIVFGLVKRLSITAETKAVLGLESALTDILATLGAFVMFTMMTSGQAVDPGSIIGTAGASIAVGLGLGLGAGIPWIYVESRLSQSKHSYMFTLAALFALFFAAKSLGESGALTALVFGLTIGNRDIIAKYLKIQLHHVSTDNPFHDQVTFLVRTFFFMFIGLLATIGRIEYIALGLAMAGAIFGIRILVTRASYTAGASLVRLMSKVVPLKWASQGDIPLYDRKITAVMLPRGLAAAVLSTVPLTMGIPNAGAFPQIVFMIIIGTVVITTVGMVYAKKKPRPDKHTMPASSV